MGVFVFERKENVPPPELRTFRKHYQTGSWNAVGGNHFHELL